MRITSETAHQNVFVNQAAANADETATAKDKTSEAQNIQGDVVDISDEGVRRSKADQSAKAANAQDARGGEGNDAGKGGTASGKVSAAKLEEQLNAKKSEVKRKQEKLDTLKRQTEEDATKDGEAKKLQGEIDRLKKEEKQLKSEMNR